LFNLAELFVTIRADNNPLKVGLNAAHGILKGFVHVGTGIGQSLGSALFAPIRAVGDDIAGLLKHSLEIGAAGAGGALLYSVKVAKDLVETTTKVGFAFGRAKAIIVDAAEDMAKRFGVSKRTFMDSAFQMGQMGKAIGYTRAKAAEFGVEMTKLAVDASSFFNVPIAEAMEKISSGLAGMERPLREWGVFVSEDTVKDEALRMGLIKTDAELTDRMKIQVRSVLIMRGLKDAQGDLERTSGSLANRLRAVWGRIEELAETIGTHLLPVAKELAVIVTDLIQGFNQWAITNASKITEWVEKLRDLVRWMGTLADPKNQAQVGKIFEAGMERWKDISKEFFSTLAENFKRLAEYFGEVLSYAMNKAITPNRPGFVKTAQAAAAGIGAGIGAKMAGGSEKEVTEAMRRAAIASKEGPPPVPGPRFPGFVTPNFSGALGPGAAPALDALQKAQDLKREADAWRDAQDAHEEMIKKIIDTTQNAFPETVGKVGNALLTDIPKMLKGTLLGRMAGDVSEALGKQLLTGLKDEGEPVAEAKVPKPKKQKENTFQGLEEFIKNIQIGALSKDDATKQIADNTGKTKDLLTEMRDLQKDAVGKQPLAVAAGPE
jgi:hypothetical protein